MVPRACDPSEAKSSDQFLQNANQIPLPHRLAAIWGTLSMPPEPRSHVFSKSAQYLPRKNVTF